MDLSILIVSYNTKVYLQRCIESIFKSQTQFTYEVIIVDNNSTDGTLARFAEFPWYSKVRMIRNRYNYGFSVAMNQAYHVSGGRYVMSFNPDAEVLPDTLQRAVDYMELNPHVGKIGFSTVNGSSLVLPTVIFPKYNSIDLWRIFTAAGDRMVSNEARRVDWIFGTGLVIRRDAISSGKLYPENSFLFWEEYDLSLAIKNRNFEIHIVPSISITHHASVTFKNSKDRIQWARLLSHAHEWRVRRQHFGRSNAIVNSFLLLLDNLLIYTGLWLKDRVLRRNNERWNEMIDRFARFRAGFIVLFSTPKKRLEINTNAMIFFNHGQKPPYPPLTRD